MFQSLQDGLAGAFKSISGKGKLTEANMRDGLRLVEQALLEADVSYEVVKEFMSHITEQALGEKVLLSLKPGEQLMGFVYQELLNFLGPVDPSLHLRGDTTVIMLCGLQGSGKTTTCGKLSRLIKENGKTPFMVAADLQRPAAIEQLHVLGEQLGVSVYSDLESKDPVKVCRDAIKKAKEEQADVVILDTAGRLAIDEELMKQLQQIDNQVQPDQVYFVVDGMTGQDAVNSAKHFNAALELNGVIMTKLDGDSRGGALLSVKHIADVPVKIVGTGEHLDALEPFHPDRMAQRILGGGDLQSMAELAQREFDQDEMKKTEEALKSGQFTLQDFRKQLQQIAKPGLMQKMMGMMPGMGELNKMVADTDATKDMGRLMGIIDSMTPSERENPKLIEPSRRQRIAAGAGVQTQEVNELVKQFDGMKAMMEQMAGAGMKDRMQMMKQMQEGGQLSPGGQIAKPKKGTGKRLTASDRAKMKKMRDKERRKQKKKRKK